MNLESVDGGFEKFCKRRGIHSVVRHGEAVSSDKAVAKAFVKEFTEFMEVMFLIKFSIAIDRFILEGDAEEDVHHTFGEGASGTRASEGQAYPLFCVIASRDFKVKPLNMYHSRSNWIPSSISSQ